MEATGSNERLRWLLTVLVLGLTFFAIYAWWRVAARPDPGMLLGPPELDTPQATAGARSVAQVAVDVVGAVQKPGLYYLPADSRVDDAIKAAGGLAPDANRDAVNLATRVKDEQQLRVPRVEDETEHASIPPVASPETRARVDLNAADARALEELPGIGPATAREIIAYRSSHGPFQAVDQLDDVPGIGAVTLSSLRDLVTVGGK